MSEPGLIELKDYQDSLGDCGEKSWSSYNHVNPGQIPCRLAICILFIFIHCFIGGLMLFPQSHPPLVPGGEKFENLSTLLKNH